MYFNHNIMDLINLTPLQRPLLTLLLLPLVCSLVGAINQLKGIHDMCEFTATNHQGSSPSEEAANFIITANQTKYLPGHLMTVTVESTEPIQGIILEARSKVNERLVGGFSALDKTVKTYTCNGVSNSTLTAWMRKPTYTVSYQWRAPPVDEGPVKFVATVYEDGKHHWSNIISQRLYSKGFNPIDLEGCGKSKGCFRYGPLDCDVPECEYVMTYRVQGEQAEFELSSHSAWVAIGFSSDNKMGGDDVLMCVTTRNGLEVRHYWNPYENAPPTLETNNPTENHQVHVSDEGYISCRFTRPLKINNDQHSIDLNNDWFRLYAWGPISTSYTLLRHKLPKPPTSGGKKTLFMKENIQSAASKNINQSEFCVLLSACLLFFFSQSDCLFIFKSLL